MNSLLDIGLSLLSTTQGMFAVHAYCELALIHHAAHAQNDECAAMKAAKTAAHGLDGRNRVNGYCHLTETFIELGRDSEAQAALSAAMTAADLLEGTEKAYALTTLGDCHAKARRSEAATTIFEKAVMEAQRLLDNDKASVLGDTARHFLRAGYRSRTEELAREVADIARRLGGHERLFAHDLLASIYVELGDTVSARVVLDDALHGNDAVAGMPWVFALVGMAETCVQLGDLPKARDALARAEKACDTSEDDITLLSLARGYAALNDLSAIHSLMKRANGQGRVRIASTVAKMVLDNHKDSTAAAAFLCMTFDAMLALQGRARSRMIARLAPLCLQLREVYLSSEQYTRLAAVAQQLKA